MVIAGASSETLRNEKLMERGEGGQRCSGRTDLHAGAGSRIEHPDRYLDDHSGLQLDCCERAIGAVFDALKACTTPKVGMPTIMDDAILPDMGRMNGR
ncbi:MAG: hypothetical protein F4X98_00085 [Gammaproteobacteria bacterium]|nr:hypothetical protein [Gammaproteobacteria bacterium]